MLHRRIRRHPGIASTGIRRYFLTFCTHSQRRIFCNSEIVTTCLTQIVRAAVATDFEVIAYCFMPDHLHLFVRGTTQTSDLCKFTKRSKQMSGYHGKRVGGHRLWQPGYFEHTLKEDEDGTAVVTYILDNPVRAGLVSAPSQYPFARRLTPTP